MVRDERKNRKKSSWSDILRGSSLPQCWQLLFLVSLILRSMAFTQNQMLGRTFFSCEIYTQGLTPRNVSVVSMGQSLGRVLSMNLAFTKPSEENANCLWMMRDFKILIVKDLMRACFTGIDKEFCLFLWPTTF